jgi:hypothetical protein
MIPDWVSFLAYPNLFGIKGFVGGGGVVVVVGKKKHFSPLKENIFFTTSSTHSQSVLHFLNLSKKAFLINKR